MQPLSLLSSPHDWMPKIFSGLNITALNNCSVVSQLWRNYSWEEKAFNENLPAPLDIKLSWAVLLNTISTSNNPKESIAKRLDDIRSKINFLNTSGLSHFNTLTEENLKTKYRGFNLNAEINDKEIFIEMVLKNLNNYKTVNTPSNLKKEWGRELISSENNDFRYSESLYEDKDSILLIVEKNPQALKHASKLKTDPKFILSAVKKNFHVLEYADKSLTDNESIIFEAVKIDGRALEYANKTLKENEKIVFLAVGRHGGALLYANKFKNNKEYVLLAVENFGLALEYASSSLKDNKEIVINAVKQHPFAIRFASDTLQKDPEVRAMMNRHEPALKTYFPFL